MSADGRSHNTEISFPRLREKTGSDVIPADPVDDMGNDAEETADGMGDQNSRAGTEVGDKNELSGVQEEKEAKAEDDSTSEVIDGSNNQDNDDASDMDDQDPKTGNVFLTEPIGTPDSPDELKTPEQPEQRESPANDAHSNVKDSPTPAGNEEPDVDDSSKN